MLSTLDEFYLRETADRFAGPLMRTHFPGVSWEPGPAQLGSDS